MPPAVAPAPTAPAPRPEAATWAGTQLLCGEVRSRECVQIPASLVASSPPCECSEALPCPRFDLRARNPGLRRTRPSQPPAGQRASHALAAPPGYDPGGRLRGEQQRGLVAGVAGQPLVGPLRGRALARCRVRPLSLSAPPPRPRSRFCALLWPLLDRTQLLGALPSATAVPLPRTRNAEQPACVWHRGRARRGSFCAARFQDALEAARAPCPRPALTVASRYAHRLAPAAHRCSLASARGTRPTASAPRSPGADSVRATQRVWTRRRCGCATSWRRRSWRC